MFKTALIRFGAALLAIACLAHAFEHYESVAFEKCLAACGHGHIETTANSADSDLAGHDHACTPHEHSPAVVEFSAPFFAVNTVAGLSMDGFRLPPMLPRKIKLPPRLA